jgi:hypothetical protein
MIYANPNREHTESLRAAMRACLLIVLGLSSCASPLADYSGYVAPRPYAVDCGAAWQYAATALKANGFTIAEVRRESTSGVVIGKRDGESMSMAVSCEADGVHVTPSGPTPFARNGLIIAFERVMASESAVRPPQGIEVKAELITGPETVIYFSRGLDASLVAVRFRIANGGTRPMSLPTDKIRMRTSSGATAAPLSSDEIQRRLPGAAVEILPRLLHSGVLRTGDRADGFLIFPTDRYDSALVKLVDVETQEAEEFETTFSTAAQ